MGSQIEPASPLVKIGTCLVAALFLLPWMAQNGVAGAAAYLLVGAAGVQAAAWLSGPQDRLGLDGRKHLVLIGWPVFLALAAFQALLDLVGSKPADTTATPRVAVGAPAVAGPAVAAPAVAVPAPASVAPAAPVVPGPAVAAPVAASPAIAATSPASSADAGTRTAGPPGHAHAAAAAATQTTQVVEPPSPPLGFTPHAEFRPVTPKPAPPATARAAAASVAASPGKKGAAAASKPPAGGPTSNGRPSGGKSKSKSRHK